MKLINENVENYIHGQHIFETPDDIYINGQGYDKNTMEFKPFVFFNTDKAFAKKNLLLHQIDNITYDKDWYDQDYCRYLQDNQDYNTFYYVSEINYNDKNQYINKVQKIDDTWKITKSITPNDTFIYGRYKYNYQDSSYYVTSYSTGNVGYQILGQTRDYIIILQSKQLEMYGSNSNGQNLTMVINSYLDHTIININDLTRDYNSLTRLPFPILDTCTIYAIQKSDFTISTYKIENSYSDVYIKTIHETNESIYLYANFIHNIYIYQYLPASNQLKILLSYNIENDSDNNINENTKIPKDQLMGISNIININDSFYCITGTANKYYFLKINIDYKTNKANYTKININNNVLPMHSFYNPIDKNNPIATPSSKCYYNLFKINDYIGILTYTTTTKIPNYHDTGFYQNYSSNGTYDITISYNSNNPINSHYDLMPISWEILSLFELKDNKITCLECFNNNSKRRCRGMLQKNENQIFILYQDALEGYIIQDNKLYNNFELLENEQQIGFDELKRLYVIDQNSKIKILDDPISYYVNASFEKSDYTYNDKDIQTYITINSKNYLNKNIKSKVQITLDGPCKFTSNNSKKIITYTSATENVKVPVTVTYGGTVNCYIKEVE